MTSGERGLVQLASVLIENVHVCHNDGDDVEVGVDCTVLFEMF